MLEAGLSPMGVHITNNGVEEQGGGGLTMIVNVSS
jgi:hypothetical protein